MDNNKIEELKPYIVAYLKNMHQDDIVFENENITVDLDKLYNYGVVDFIEYLINNPPEGIEILAECYKEAYFALKTEQPAYTTHIYIKNIPNIFKTYKNKKLTIKDIKSSTIGKLIEFEGIIVLATKIKSILKKAVYQCSSCGNPPISLDIDNPYEFNYDSKTCKKCNGIMKLIEGESEYADFQELKIQQPLDLMDDPEEPPKYITVFLENSKGIYCGRVNVIGIPIKYQSSKKLPIYDICVKGISCELIENQMENKVNEEDIEKIEKVATHPDIINILSNELIPEIKGYETIKKAIFLQQIKGVKKGNKRADSHILLITDPGIGKSVMLRKIAELPGNVYGSVTTASGVGLTAAVVRERTEIGDDTWVIKPGLLVKANLGTACIDELTVNRDLQSFVLEAMESQTIHINKGGINTKLPAECAIIAACNPRWGKFDPNVSIPEQINIPAPMLSRFDIIFPIKDEVNRTKDKEIAQHIIGIHKKYLEEDQNTNKRKNKVVINDIELTEEFILKYIIYARGKQPIISKEAEDMLVEYYIDMRKSSMQITARQLEATIRIAEAHAKAKLKDVVEKEDAQEAIRIINEALKEIAYDPETGMIDVGKITGQSTKETDKMKEIYNIIKKISEKTEKELVLSEDIMEEAEKIGIKEETEVENILKKLKIKGEIDEPRNGKYRII
ncbi:MCM family protein [Methanococcus aeolicus Nankai-3]|uniref:MCM family protein n=1 Tax=Methanococcus aeolicus (strain ATCC BAA-1280 / DSM 17508 / OCM 812 / Nankai-3) TaxID=419665 RepID=A6UW49_META3|nr:minichromosome maintenance protein MCM [Methanococcus aeolicus]ABR56721.1 MCM family protein [Methanococcus aeolicus Nankai-3]